MQLFDPIPARKIDILWFYTLCEQVVDFPCDHKQGKLFFQDQWPELYTWLSLTLDHNSWSVFFIKDDNTTKFGFVISHDRDNEVFQEIFGDTLHIA